MRAGDLVRYRNTSENEEEEWESQWDRIKDLRGIVLPRDPREPRSHIRIMWNTGEIMIHLIPPYDPQEHFEVISGSEE